jgi:hypothetical protein
MLFSMLAVRTMKKLPKPHCSVPCRAVRSHAVARLSQSNKIDRRPHTSLCFFDSLRTVGAPSMWLSRNTGNLLAQRQNRAQLIMAAAMRSREGAFVMK